MHTNMKITVDNEGNTGCVQEQFNAYFPYLKLEFYDLHEAMVKSTAVKPFMDPRYKLRDSRKSIKGGEIIVDGEMTVAQLERKVYETFGIHAEVLRKSGNIWLETTLTSEWTLHQQNVMGETIS